MEDKMMRKIILALIAGFILIGFQGCLDDDGYSLGDYWVTTATIEKTDVSPYIIVTDNGDRLYPSASNVLHFNTKDGQRVWVNYTILGDATGNADYYVKVNDLSEILTKGILQLTPENNDSIGNDPVRVEGYWFTGDYFTIRFAYSGGGTIHYINLVQDVDNPTNEEGLAVLEFRHNRNKDYYNYAMKGTVSFNLDGLKKDDSDAVQFVLKAKNFRDEEDFEKKLTFEYNK